MDSSSAQGAAPPNDPTGSNFTFVAQNLGCGSLTAAAELECMKIVPSPNITAFLKSYQDAGTRPAISFNPIVDNVSRFANYTERAFAGNFSKVVCTLNQYLRF
jgi:acetylcholinesterase